MRLIGGSLSRSAPRGLGTMSRHMLCFEGRAGSWYDHSEHAVERGYAGVQSREVAFGVLMLVFVLY